MARLEGPLQAVVAAVLLGLCLPRGPSTAASSTRNEGCGAIEARLAPLRDFVFPREIPTRGITKSLQYRDKGYLFNSLEEVRTYNLLGQDLVPDTAGTIVWKHAPLESPFRASLAYGERAPELIAGVEKILAVPAAAAKTASVCSLHQKLLAQRDLYQIFMLLVQARDRAGETMHARAGKVLYALSRMINETLFSMEEYRDLVAALPRSTSGTYSPVLTYDLTDNYLPEVVLRDDPSWVAISNRGQPLRHFTHYQGRSFSRVYLRTNGSKSELDALRKKLFMKYGPELHAVAVPEKVPRGLTTVLVRTTSVLLRDGTIRDSRWPEEVIIRAFKYDAGTLDAKTSDFTGTLFYQYRLSRELLLEDPSTLGLFRILDDDEEFFGFFGDAPDARHALSAGTTTMRINCIGCHAETFYGVNTVFSFARNPELESLEEDNEIWTNLGGGAYQMRTGEFRVLSQLFTEMAAVAK